MNPKRRKVIKAAYVAPAILTLKATPALATPGSTKPQQTTGRELRPIEKPVPR